MTALIDWRVSTFQAQPLHFSLQVTGVIGSCVYVCRFFLVQSGRICGNGVLYPFMQMFAADCFLASRTTAFNLAAIIVQIDVYATPSIIEAGGDDEHLPALHALGATAQ